MQVDQLERASSVSRKKRKSDGAVKEDVDEEPTSALTPKGKGKMKTVKKNEHEEEKKAGPRKRRKVETRKKQDSDVEDEDDAPTSSSRRKGRQTQRENMFKSAVCIRCRGFYIFFGGEVLFLIYRSMYQLQIWNRMNLNLNQLLRMKKQKSRQLLYHPKRMPLVTKRTRHPCPPTEICLWMTCV